MATEEPDDTRTVRELFRIQSTQFEQQVGGTGNRAIGTSILQDLAPRVQHVNVLQCCESDAARDPDDWIGLTATLQDVWDYITRAFETDLSGGVSIGKPAHHSEGRPDYVHRWAVLDCEPGQPAP